VQHTEWIHDWTSPRSRDSRRHARVDDYETLRDGCKIRPSSTPHREKIEILHRDWNRSEIDVVNIGFPLWARAYAPHRSDGPRNRHTPDEATPNGSARTHEMIFVPIVEISSAALYCPLKRNVPRL